MSYEANLRKSALMSVMSMTFDDRDAFVKSHQYDKANAPILDIDCKGLNREQTLNRYYPHYTLDHLFEYCVVRNLISLLNAYGQLKGKRAFTLGHYLPLGQGGTHNISNWIIQTASDNQRQGCEAFEETEKWSLTQQVNYIMSKIDYHLGVDESYLDELQSYIMAFGKVYNNGKKQ